MNKELKVKQFKSRLADHRDQPVVICSMGRSGSSMLAGLLTRLGVFMGHTFIPRNHQNKYGTFEDIEFITLCRHVVAGICTLEAWYEQIEPLITRRFERYHKTNQRWGWKCPITTNLMSIFVTMLPEAKYLRITRKKEDVFASCHKCYGWDEKNFNDIWTVRTSEMDEYLKDPLDVHHIHFEDLIDNPTDVLSGVCKWLKIDFNESVVDFIDRKEVHFGKTKPKIITPAGVNA